MGASIARKLTRSGPRVFRHQLVQVCVLSCLMTCFSCAAIVFRYSKRARTFFTYYVPPEVTLLEIPPCQTPMCGVAYSCSYVLLMASNLKYCIPGNFRKRLIFVLTFPSFSTKTRVNSGRDRGGGMVRQNERGPAAYKDNGGQVNTISFQWRSCQS